MLLKIKLHPEIITKSESVRKRFVKILASNIRQSLLSFDLESAIQRNWDHLIVRAKCDPTMYPVFIQIIRQVPGIQRILLITKTDFVDFDTLFQQVLELNREKLTDKSFAVRVKRRGKHEFNSLDLERYVGGGLKQHVPNSRVQLTNPDYTVNIELDNDTVFLVEHEFDGIGGFPIGTQDSVLSLISGGYDSAVSSYQMIRRGCRVHYLFFNLGGNEHVQHVKRISRKIWQGYSSSHNVKFISVDFYNIMLNISNYVADGYTGVALKRMFYRVAAAVAERMRIDGIVTGEALGQVSSQTLKNLRVIEKVTDLPILRPLVAIDKEEIIKIAREIGTADLSAQVQEFCGIMGKKPTIAADEQVLLAEEAKLEVEALVQEAVEKAEIYDLRELAKQDLHTIETTAIEYVTSFAENDVVIDVRDPDTVEADALVWEVPNLNIPFYNLGEAFANLDQSKRYALYCTKGLLSKIQAVNLIERGFKNVVLVSKDFKLTRG